MKAEIEKFNNELQEEIHKKMADAGDTFSIMYRTYPGSPELDYSEYFFNELQKRQGKELDEEKEIDMRTNRITWELFLERNLFSVGQNPPDYRKILTPQTNLMGIDRLRREIHAAEEKLDDLRAEFNNRNEVANRGEHYYYGDTDHEYKLSILTDIPSLLKNSFNIVNYPKWGEYVEFDYNKLKADALDEFMKTGSKEALDIKYNTLLHTMEKFPNKYNLKSEKIIEINAEKPYDLIIEENMKIERKNELRHTSYYGEIVHKIHEFIQRKPVAPEDRDARDAWRFSLEAWKNELKEFYNNIEQEYKDLQIFNCVLSSHIQLV